MLTPQRIYSTNIARNILNSACRTANMSLRYFSIASVSVFPSTGEGAMLLRCDNGGPERTFLAGFSLQNGTCGKVTIRTWRETPPSQAGEAFKRALREIAHSQAASMRSTHTIERRKAA